MTDEVLGRDPGSALTGAPPSTAAGEPPSAPAPPDGSTREQELQDERDRFYDLLLRKTAEFDNYRKRIDRERREQADRAISEFVLEVLPVIDDLERALRAPAGGAQAEAYRTGVELIYRQLLEILKRRGVRPFESLGADFDPHLHQAVVSAPVEGRRDGEIVEEFGRGYMIGDRLLRPALVKVAQP